MTNPQPADPPPPPNEAAAPADAPSGHAPSEARRLGVRRLGARRLGARRLGARRTRWAGLDGARDDRRSALLTVLLLAVAGLPAGLVWWWLAPRTSFRVTATDVVPIGGTPSSELFMADDGVYLLVLAALGLLAGIAVWLWRRHRGVVALTALATGMIAASVVAWQLGELLGRGPTDQQLAAVGATVTTGLRLGAVAAVAVGPFVAVLAYLLATMLTSTDDLGRELEQPLGPREQAAGSRVGFDRASLDVSPPS